MAALLASGFESERDCPSPGIGILRIPEFRLVGGDGLVDAQLAWQSWGSQQSAVVIVLGGISAGRDIGAWWKQQCGQGQALDPQQHRLLSIDWLGGSDASSGPIDDSKFPQIDTLDQAHAILILLNQLGIAHVEAIVGASYGGCVGQHLAALLGSRLGKLVVIGAAHRASPWALALRTLQRAGIESATDAQGRRAALQRARQLAVLGYRTPAELECRFGETDAGTGVLGWLNAQGERFAERFNEWSFLRLSASLDAHLCAPETIQSATTVIAIAEDLLVPLGLAEEFVRRLGARAELVEISSHFGHDAFLKEDARIGQILRNTLCPETTA